MRLAVPPARIRVRDGALTGGLAELPVEWQPRDPRDGSGAVMPSPGGPGATSWPAGGRHEGPLAAGGELESQFELQ
jgi:hypothetical protein